MKDDTKLAAVGRPHRRPAHPVNHPVERASTFLFPTYDDFLEGSKNIVYGRLGTTTHRALEETVNLLEGGFETRLAPSGLAAVNASILAFCAAGDQVLVTDAVYDPVRKFCDKFLTRYGVKTIYYDPMIGADIAELMTDRTKVVLAESPGSLTFEVEDLPALAEAARRGGAKLIVDNTWSAGRYLKPLALGAHVSVQSATKYLSGHADLLLGAISSADEATAKAIYYALLQLGSNVSADDAYLTLRGIRTLAARLARHGENGLALAKWLSKRPEISRLLHPAMKGAAGHQIWRRDFTGASGLFGAVLRPTSPAALKAFFNALKIFGMGFSWGGFESLCVPVSPDKCRTAKPWREDGPTLRFHAGLEDIEDLIIDLDRAFAAMNAAKG
ncbi:MAG: cystathionine beta-lyase [Amphiplicatus sp.]